MQSRNQWLIGEELYWVKARKRVEVGSIQAHGVEVGSIQAHGNTLVACNRFSLICYSLRTARCDSLRFQTKSDNVKQDLTHRVGHGEADFLQIKIG